MGMMGIMEEALRRRRMRAGVHLHKKPAIQDTGHTKQILAKEVDRRHLDEGQGSLKAGIQFTNRRLTNAVRSGGLRCDDVD